MKGKPGKTVMSGFGNEAALPVIDAARCTKCGLCVKACKTATIITIDDAPKVVPDNRLGCIGCGQCMMVCPKGAVTVTGRRIGFGDAFILPKKEKRATPESLEALLVSRRSVREYAARDVDKKNIDRILTMSASAPMGIPPSDVSVIVLNGRDRVREFADDILSVFGKWLQFFNPLVLALMRPFMKKTEIETLRDFFLPVAKSMIDGRKRDIDLLFYGAPVVLLFHQSPYAEAGDSYIACTYAMTAAESLGLGTCMIGTIAIAMEREKQLKEKWGVPAGNKVALAMIVGYPAFRYTRGIRRTFAGIEYK